MGAEPVGAEQLPPVPAAAEGGGGSSVLQFALRSQPRATIPIIRAG